MADDPAYLLTAAAVRERCHAMLGLAEAGALAHFAVDLERLPAAADYVAEVIRRNYLSLAISHHARWRHFAAGGIDRWSELENTLNIGDKAERARARIDLCVVSVLLDAGAGPDWRYTEPGTGLEFARSEGLAIASLHAFAAGLFSSNGVPQADAEALSHINATILGQAFQVHSHTNPIAALEGRAALLRSLAAALKACPDLFGPGRPGYLFDALTRHAPLRAPAILETLLDGLGPIWPGRVALKGRNLGDTWPHPAAPGGLVPFHKLSQWLAYSLIEVFEDAGVPVEDIGQLTGLPEYRNGGLLLDTGVLRLRDPAAEQRPHLPGDQTIVEWRALTVALLDRLAPLIRQNLNCTEQDLPLSHILEGGTWSAGRAIAAERREGGAPPLHVISDGTVF